MTGVPSVPRLAAAAFGLWVCLGAPVWVHGAVTGLSRRSRLACATGAAAAAVIAAGIVAAVTR